MKIAIVFVLISIACAGIGAIELSAQNKAALVVLPFTGSSIDSASKQTAIKLLRRELDRSDNYKVIADNGALTPCSDVACAIDAGKKAGAAVVVYGGFGKLGTKLLISYSVFDVATRAEIVSGDVSASSTEDLDVAITDVAHRVTTGKDETLVVPTRVLNRPPYVGVIGVGFGEMYRTGGFNNITKAVAFDLRFSLEYPKYSLNLLSAWRYGPMLNFGGSYIFSPGNFAPYLGGGIGYHVFGNVSDDPYASSDEEVSSGFQMIIGGGLWILRTNDLRFFANLDYMKTFVGSSSAVVFTIGVAGSAIVRL
jgi:hypothetical protein